MDRDDQPTREASTDQPDQHQEDTMDDERNDRRTSGGATPALDEDRPWPAGTGTASEPPTDGTADRTPEDSAGTHPVDPPVDQDRGVRVGTVVWGLVLTAIGVGLLAVASGVVFDVELAMIILVAAAGVALLTGSILTEVRRRGR